MRLAFYTVCISPHQLPLAREFVKCLGPDNFRYICYEPMDEERAKLGWQGTVCEPWILQAGERDSEREEWLEHADLLMTYIRDLDLLERRSTAGLRSFYSSERWFKPPIGRLRMLVPGFRKMARRFVRLAQLDPRFSVLPIGIVARRDFARIGVPENKMTTWGYFVAPSTGEPRESSRRETNVLKILWVGRMLALKHVETLISAVVRCAVEFRMRNDEVMIELTLVGDGPEKARLQKMAQKESACITFLPSVPVDKVRAVMRDHDVYVFASNGYDGWGAVVSEALEEGMIVLGTNQAGASATILPPWQRFDSGDVKRLAELLKAVARDRRQNLEGKRWVREIGGWTAVGAAEKLLRIAKVSADEE